MRSPSEGTRASRVVGRSAICTLAVVASVPALGAALSSESTVALMADYNSNPFLLPSGAHSAESEAIIATVPLTYTTDAQALNLVPSVRIAQTQGEDELLTNYQYLNGDWHLSTERNTFSASAGAHRDSTFYNVSENAQLQGHTLPRLEELARLGYQRALTERSSFQIEASWDQARFDSKSSFSLTNYDYLQGSLSYSFLLSERWTMNTSAGEGRYRIRGEDSSKENRFIQSSLAYTLSERWSASAQLGLSLVTSTGPALLCCRIGETAQGAVLELVRVTQRSSGKSLNYLASFQHQNEDSLVSFSASRSVQPSALGALLTQDDVVMSVNFPVTERLSAGSALHGTRLSDTLARGASNISTRYADAELSLSWNWTEHWALTLVGSYAIQQTNGQDYHGSNSKASLTLTRALGRIKF